MKAQPKTILIFDENNNFKEIIALYLKNKNWDVKLVKNYSNVLKVLSKISIFALVFNTAVVSDTVTDFIAKVKGVYPLLPIMAITPEDNQEQVVSLLQNGVYACLTAPLHKEKLIFQLNRITVDRLETHNPFNVRFEERIVVISNEFSLVPTIARNIVENSLPLDEKNKYQIVLGLTEIINNAIEHGNLGISSSEKQEALEQSTFYDMASKRAVEHPYNTRFVTVKTKVSPSSRMVEYEVSDEGEGFDWQSLPAVNKKDNLLRNSGRGILISRHIFNDVIFNDNGSKVTLLYRVKSKERA